MADNDAAMREQLAALCHEQWAGWMRYLFDLTITVGNDCEEIQSADVKRWMRQIQTPYCELPENEKDSDRAEADRFLAILSATCASLRAERDQLRKALAGLALTTESVTATAWSDNDSLIAERDSLREALGFCHSLAEEELEYAAKVGTGAEVALRHIERRSRAVLAKGEKR